MVSVGRVGRAARPRIPLRDIAEHVLGKNYDLSVVLCGNETIRRLNRAYRGKAEPTNILSFPYAPYAGEIFFNTGRVRREAEKYRVPQAAYAAYIFIHGLLHLKGFKHGSKMEIEEARILRRFGYREPHSRADTTTR